MPFSGSPSTPKKTHLNDLEQLSYVERAGRIAVAYWDDPAKWAGRQGGKCVQAIR